MTQSDDLMTADQVLLWVSAGLLLATLLMFVYAALNRSGVLP